jgi:hypothetical protein
MGALFQDELADGNVSRNVTLTLTLIGCQFSTSAELSIQLWEYRRE